MLTALMLTNLYRTRHQSPPIKWNAKLAQDAQKWADKLAKEDSGLKHDKNISDGENLAEMPANDKAIVMAIDTWYDEVNKYSFKNHTFSKDTGHFSQVGFLKLKVSFSCARLNGVHNVHCNTTSTIYLVRRTEMFLSLHSCFWFSPK